MKNIVLLLLFLVPAFLFAQYPATGNKQRLGYQTTGDGLIWRGVAGDTVNKPNNRNYPYFQLDTVNGVLYRYIQTRGQWQPTSLDIDSLIYATRYWVNSNFFPLQGGTMTGTGGAGFIGFPSQVVAPGAPASGLNVYAQGSSFNWKGTDGFERLFASTLTGGRTYTLPDVSGTFALGTGTTDRSARWSATNTLAAGNFTDNGTKLEALLPFQFASYTTAGLPTGVTGYHIYNTTTNGPGWYQGSRWAYALESTFARGTATRVPFFDANGQITESANLTYTGSRFRTGGSIRFGLDNSATDTASIEKVRDGNSRVVRFNNPGLLGAWNGGFVFRGGFNGVLSTANTFRIYMNSSTVAGSVYVGNVGEGDAQAGDATTNLGVLNKITSTTTYDSGINLNANGASPNNFVQYSLTNGKQFGIFIGGQGGTNQFQSMNDLGYGVFAGFQYQPSGPGYACSWVFSAKNDASTPTEILRLQGKDGNVCLGCTNAQYQLYTTNTGAYGFPRGTVAQRPTIVTSTTPLRYNTDSTALEYGESVGTWRQIATRAYARSLVAGLSTGTVTSVGLSLPSIFSVSGSPVTTSGTLSATFTGGNTKQVLRGDGIWSNTLDSFRINQSLASSEIFEVNGNILLSRNSQSHRLYFDKAWSQYTWGDGANGNMTYRNGGGPGFQNYFILGTISGTDTITTMHYNGLGVAVGKSNKVQARLHVKGTGTTTGKTMLLQDSGGADILTITDNKTIQAHAYGTGTKEAADLSKTQSNYIAGFATDGTVLDLERKRDTTIFVTADTDYDFSAAVTTAQIASRYNRIIIHMTLTSGVGADKTTTLHTPDANLMQCEILIRGTDNTGSYDNEINFGTNNAISSDGTNASGYTLAQGQGLHVRVVYNGSAYKYIYY